MTDDLFSQFKSPTVKKQKKKTGFEKILINGENRSIKKNAGGVYLDLSASAKGFGVDSISQFLRKQGIENHMVEIGGEVRTAGTKHGSSWKIAIESPDLKSKLGQKILNLKNHSLATSGSYRNFFEEKGKKYSHAINYKTGKPIEHKLISVSVLSNSSCLEADSWATAFMVMGHVKGFELAKELGFGAYFIYEEDSIQEKMTSPFKALLGANK